jgi:hypothetical protein
MEVAVEVVGRLIGVHSVADHLYHACLIGVQTGSQDCATATWVLAGESVADNCPHGSGLSQNKEKGACASEFTIASGLNIPA